jgi:dTDP-3,4-didehydro-2,6-dideoxy-alpha-D-glucose 3-reductase
MNRIKIGVLGTANIAIRSVIPAIIANNRQFQFIGVATRHISEEDKDLEIPLIEGYDHLLNDYQLDAVYIPLPNSKHYEWVKKSLEKGIHVLVEKSLACNLEEAEELNGLAKKNKLVLVENFQFRFHSQLKYILDLVQEEILGDLRIVRSTFCFPPFPSKENIRYRKNLGGGALLDAGAYPIKLSQIILGNDLEVTSAVLNYDEKTDVDIWGGACLKQRNGNLFSQIAFGFDNYYQCNIELIGSKGKLYTNRLFTAKADFKPTLILETNESGRREIELAADDHFKNMLGYFYDLIKDGYNNDLNNEYYNNISQARILQELRYAAK